MSLSTPMPYLSELGGKMTPLLAEYSQTSLYQEELIPLAIRGFLIVGAFVVLPVAIAWFFSRCADIHEARHPEPDDE